MRREESWESSGSSGDPSRTSTATRSWLRLLPALVLLLSLAGVAAVRLSLLHVALSPDEAGFLRIGGQWSPGSSLYGDYWVSRPPGIIAIFGVASLLGGDVALRVIGLLFALVSVLLGVGIGRAVTPGRTWPGVLTGVLVAALVSTPAFDVNIVDGELLALPFLLAGVLCALRAVVGDPTHRARLLWAVGAGASGAAAISVKQNLLGVPVLVGGLVLVLLVRRAWRPAGQVVAGALLGALALVVPLLALAAWRGTTLPALWDAVVMFRFRAAEVLGRPSDVKHERWVELVEAFRSTRSPWLVLLLPTVLVPRRRRSPGRGGVGPDDPLLAVAALGLVAWEAVSVVAGGGFWLHYLMGMIPGLTLLLALSFARVPAGGGRRRQALHWLPRVALVGAVVAATWSAVVPFLDDPPRMSRSEASVAAYLREHRDLGSTAVIAFGRPTILQAADLQSPYRQLWTIPVLTDDPDLTELAPVLADQRATWVVLRTSKLRGWGLTDTEALRNLSRDYELVHRSGTLEVWQARSAG